MQNRDYHQSLEDAVKALHQAEIELFTAMVNVGFKGPYEDISRLHEVGEVLNLELVMFEGTQDANLEALVEVVKQVARTKQIIINMNALDIEIEES